MKGSSGFGASTGKSLTATSSGEAAKSVASAGTLTGRRPDEMARRVGYVFQHADQQLFERTVRRDVAFGPRRLDLGTAGVGGVLDELGLLAAADVHPYDLPAPLRKQVALAGVLAMEPGVLVLDEPTAGLDRAGRDRVVAALRRRVEGGVTVVLVSHDVAFVAEVAERVVVLREGLVEMDFDGRPVQAEFSQLDEVMHAYAVSIHKSQGSEFPVVVIPLLTQHYMMLQRNLLYTGVTRARKMVVLVGSTQAIAMAVRNDRIMSRNTRLAARIRDYTPPKDNSLYRA